MKTNVQPGNDVRHINVLIDEGHPDVKAYIENQEDFITFLLESLLVHEPDNEAIKELIQMDIERNLRTRNEKEFKNETK